jgi:hypothetical protein
MGDATALQSKLQSGYSAKPQGEGSPWLDGAVRRTEQPHYLYTLTLVGEQHREFLLALAENDASHA